MDVSREAIVSKLGQQSIASEYESHWVSHISNLVPNLAKLSKWQSIQIQEEEKDSLNVWTIEKIEMISISEDVSGPKMQTVTPYSIQQRDRQSINAWIVNMKKGHLCQSVFQIAFRDTTW